MTDIETVELLRKTLNRAYSFVLESNDLSVVTGDIKHGRYTVLFNIEESLQAISGWPKAVRKLKIKKRCGS